MLYNEYEEYKRLFSVDCTIFGYEEDKLKLLFFKRRIEPCKGKWSLLGGWVRKNEASEDAAQRVLLDLTGLDNVFQEQVYTFSKPDRDPGGEVLTVEYYALIKIDNRINEIVEKNGASWFELNQLPELIFDHNELIERALDKIRKKANNELFGKHLLPEKFTITNLRQLYNEIFQTRFDPGNFRKKVLSLGVLEKLDEKDMSESRKGAFYYRFKENKELTYTMPIFKRAININN